MRRSALVLAGLCVLRGPAAAPAQQNIDAVASDEIGGLTSGIVVGLGDRGEVSFLHAWGSPSLEEPEDSLTVDHLFPYPGLTETLVAATIRGLDAVGEIDVSAPLGGYLPGLPDRLRALTLHQLLTHTAGLDDVPPREETAWDRVLDELPPAAVFTEPGVIFSRSRYSYPLAARVLERVTGLPLPEVVHRAVLGPLGMTRTTLDLDSARTLGLARGYGMTSSWQGPVAVVEPEARSGGLPVTFTTVPDLLRLFGAWTDGRIRGVGPRADRVLDVPGVHPGGRTFQDGLALETYRGVERLSGSGAAQGFGVILHVLPRTRTVLVAWANGRAPRRTVGFIEERLAPTLGLEEGGPAPDPSHPDTAAAPLEWAGTYRNGEKIVVLKQLDGRLHFFDGVRDLPVVPLADGLWGFRVPDGRLAQLAFRLVEVGPHRFVFMNGQAYALREPGKAP